MNWCEPTICALINEPANTWSNLGYMFVGVYFILKWGSGGLKLLKHYGWVIFLMGLMSFIYHATNNFLTQIFDFLGMFGLTSFVLAFQVQRLQGKPLKNYLPPFAGFFVIQIVLFYLAHWHKIFPIQSIIAIMALPIAILEVILFTQDKERILKKPVFLVALLLLGVAVGFSLLDHHRVWCQPENVFLHGHVLWHLIGSVSMYLLGVYLKPLIEKES